MAEAPRRLLVAALGPPCRLAELLRGLLLLGRRRLLLAEALLPRRPAEACAAKARLLQRRLLLLLGIHRLLGATILWATLLSQAGIV